ncbi:MAG: hypothetical protein DMG37_06415 [Acidobacteria bacterium]|nr:MAG: hypothetical protein DMG37_06415 [Acidobacteriota bacterium]
MNAKRVVFVLAVATFSAALLIHLSPARTAIAAAPQNNQDPGGCSSLPGFSALKSAIVSATAAETSGLNNQMWATLVNRDGAVCAVAFSGVNRGAQWPGSRVISAQKANTANAFSLDSSSSSNGSGHPAGLALSTANLYSAVQPGGNLYGLQHSNPVDTGVAYGAAANYGTASDPMVGQRIGGVNVFGGGLALYASGHVIVGGVGVSGDTSCADHNIAWRVRNALGLDHMAPTGSLPGVGGVSGDPARPDNIIFDITPNPNGGTGNSAGGFGHPKCINTGDPSALPPVQP